MVLVVYGSNHRIATPSRLQAVSLEPAALLASLVAMKRRGLVRGGLLLATCNRLELVLDSVGDAPPEQLCEAFRSVKTHTISGEPAAHYLLAVACGLESMVVGEDQILGQLREAFRLSEAHGLLSATLQVLRKRLLSAARDIRRRTGLHGSKASVAGLGARQLSAQLGKNARIAIVGAGETGRLALQTLLRLGHRDILIVNRSEHRAQALGRHHGLPAMGLAEFLENRPEIDGLIAAVHSDLPILDARTLAGLTMVVDVSMPGIIDPAAFGQAGMPNVLDLDGLALLSAVDDERRSSAALSATELVAARAPILHGQLKLPNRNFGGIVEQHVDQALEELENALSSKLAHLSEQDRLLLRATVQRAAKRNAHLHLQDVKQLVRSS